MEKEANQLYRRPQMTGQARDEEEEEGSIDAMDSVKVPYVICLTIPYTIDNTICYLFDNSNMVTSKMAVSKMASFCNLLSCTHSPLCPHSYIRPLYWKATE